MRQALSHTIRLALAISLALALAGCFPGQFPSPEVRPPPAPQTNGTTATAPHGVGAQSPTWQSADAGGG